MFRLRYFIENWKLGIHLLFRTNRFGVNNEWWCSFDSIFGLPLWSRRRWDLVQNYKGMRMRCSPGISFVTLDTFKKLFPRYAKKRYTKY